MVNLERSKRDEYVTKLAEKQKLEKEKLDKMIFELENKCKATEELELEMKRIKGSVEVMLDMDENLDSEIRKEIDELEEKFAEKEQELENLQELNGALTAKERKSNDEIQEARKALNERHASSSSIGVKRMGELDAKSFSAAMIRKYKSKVDAEVKALEVCSNLESLLKDSSWYPFIVVTYKNGEPKEIIDEGDEKPKDLKTEYGEEAYNAFTTALLELNEYNPSGRTPVSELYHFKEKRRATLAEGIEHALNQSKNSKRRKTLGK